MRARSALLAFALAGASCRGASNDPGVDALLQVEGAQFVPGEMPAPGGGPAVASVSTLHSFVRPGTRNERIRGALAPEGNAAAIGLPGDVGYWVLTATPPDVQVPDLPTFGAELGFSAALPAGPFKLRVQGVDRAGRAGQPTVLDLTAIDAPTPDGAFVVSLSWDTEADLDLHVVLPDGVEVWAGNVSSYERPGPGEPPDPPDAWRAGAHLDVNSNAACVLDARRRENVVWADPPPAGRYVVCVDTFSLCGTAFANWLVEARVDGEVIASARGASHPSDTRFDHGAGAGVLALELERP